MAASCPPRCCADDLPIAPSRHPHHLSCHYIFKIHIKKTTMSKHSTSAYPHFSRSDSQAVGRMPGRLLMGQTVFCEPCNMKRLLSSSCNLDFCSWSGLFRSRFQLSFRYSPRRRAANPSLHFPSESAPKGHHHGWSKGTPEMDPKQL